MTAYEWGYDMLADVERVLAESADPLGERE